MARISKSPSYLVRNDYSYCFRMIIPKDLQAILEKKELRYSLRTGYLRLAKERSRLLAGQIQMLFRQLRGNNWMSELTQNQIQTLFNRYVRNWLVMMDNKRLEPKGELMLVEEIEGDGTTPQNGSGEYLKPPAESVRGIDEELEDEINVLRYEVQMRQYSNNIFDKLIEENNIDLPTDSTEYRKICREFMLTLIKMYEIEQRRNVGDFSDNVMELFPLEDDTPEPKDVVPSSGGEEPSILLEDLWEDYKDEKEKLELWRTDTVKLFHSRVQTLIQFIGNVPIDQVTTKMIRKYKKLLDRLPPGFTRKEYPNLNGITAEDLEGRHKKTLDATTVRDYMILIRAMFQYAKDDGLLDKNPVLTRMVPPKKKHTRNQKLPFTDPDDLSKIFEKDRYFKWSDKKPERFWVPVLALFTGCRLEELCQLYVEDIRQDDGLWCLVIKGETVANEEAEMSGQMLKNENAARTISMHPFIVNELRFPEYVQQIGMGGHKRVFPHLTKYKAKYSHYLSKDFGRYRKGKVKIDDPKKTFHSFRHNFADHLKQKAVQITIIEELEGRAGKTETQTRYTQKYIASTLYKEGILKLNYEVDLSHLKESKYCTLKGL